jgi:integrase
MSRKRKKSTKTIRIEKGGHSVSIIPNSRTANGKTYTSYKVQWTTPTGERKSQGAKTLELAKEKAAAVRAQIKAKGGVVATYSPKQVAAIETALETCTKAKVTLTHAVASYAEAALHLPEGVSLVSAVRGYAERIKKETETPILVTDLVAKYKTALREKGVKAAHQYSASIRLDRAAAYFQCNVSDVTAEAVDQWLQNLEVGPQTRKHHRRTLISLFRFAQRKNFLPSGLTEADKSETITVPSHPIDAYTPEQAAYLAEQMPDRWRAYTVLALFSGLRPAELFRLDWSDIKNDHIEVKASGSKVKVRRIVPIHSNLAAWLETIPTKKGPVVPIVEKVMKGKNLKRKQEKDTVEKLHGRQAQQLSIALRDTVAKAIAKAKKPKASRTLKEMAEGFTVIHDGLRHSYISYRVPILKDLPAVALEAGNSVEVIQEHYNKVSTEKDAKRYFSINPPSIPKNLYSFAA